MILDKKLNAILDQETRCLNLLPAPQEEVVFSRVHSDRAAASHFAHSGNHFGAKCEITLSCSKFTSHWSTHFQSRSTARSLCVTPGS